ncbi:DUF6420 family protein [Streptomyces sp. NPDC002932]|uniref:DUF6420 family protein n=1 Tax=Streptomyces sp. NPDC002932 TaxID=3364672 RepID=UPI0036A84C32
MASLIRALSRRLSVRTVGSRCCTVEVGGIDLTAFVRVALAIELGDERPVDRLLKDVEALAGPVRRVGQQDQGSVADRSSSTPSD